MREERGGVCCLRAPSALTRHKRARECVAPIDKAELRPGLEVACPFRLDGAEVHFKGKVVRLAANHAVVAFREVGDTTSTYHVDYDRMFHFVS